MLDNLNTHSIASFLYEAFPAEEAFRLAKRLAIYYTQKHGSWLNIAEIELSVLKGQCINRMIPDMELMQSEVCAWQSSLTTKISKLIGNFKPQTQESS